MSTAPASPEQLTEAEGHNVRQATYRVWGNTLEEVREPYYIEEQNLRFQGQYLDRETGLHFNTFRFYDPDVGRFTTPDPIGLAGGLNLYQYSPNPIGWTDPLGWETCRLSKADKKAMGKKPTADVMTAAHRHHIVREKAPKNWTDSNRRYVAHAQGVLKRFGIGLNDSPHNFVWAPNGSGNHTIASARKVSRTLAEARKGGKNKVIEALNAMGEKMRNGEFLDD